MVLAPTAFQFIPHKLFVTKTRNMQIHVTVNGTDCSHQVEPRLLLVHYLRDELRLTGTHIGCETSVCGSCTILVNKKATKSCTMLAVQADGCEITTIEGISSNGQLHPLQEAFRENHGLQCGFCTPGMIMTAADFLEEHPNPSEEEIRHAVKGNLCRCTGYHNIVKSIKYAAELMNSTAKIEEEVAI